MDKQTLKAAILIVSTTAAKDATTDSSGPALKGVFAEADGQWEVVETKIVSDNVTDIQRSVMSWTDQGNTINAVITTGGTGFAVSDNTPEAITPLLHKQAPGLVHGMLAASLAVTPFALMSRPVAGVRNKTIIVTLPGSPKGAKENLQSILKLLPHACLQAAGADSRTLHVGGVKKLEKEAGIGSEGASLSAHSHKHDHSHNHSHGHGHSYGHGHSHGHAMPVRHTAPDENPRSNDPALGPTRRSRSSPYPMLSVDEALKLIEKYTPAPHAVKADVNGDIVGSVLAEDVTATEAVPAYRASIVDGYAVIAIEGKSNKGVFPVASISHATAGEHPLLLEGQIARITTGAPLPPGATSVIMVEDTVLKTMTEDGGEEKEVEILADGVKPGENVREVGSDIEAGSTIMRKGEEISANGGELGLLTSVGRAEVTIYKKPIVGVLSTGDEIVEHNRPGSLRMGEVRDCNRPTIMAAVRGLGFEVVDLGIARDKPGDLEQTLREGLRKVDVVITTGGVSMGELDLLKPTIERSLGGTIHFGRVSMKPGKPTTFATVPVKNNDGERVSKVIFSLPGNPVSAIVTLHLFVLPSLHHASGISPVGLPRVPVTLSHDIRLDPQRVEYHRAIVSIGRDGLLYASSTGMQRSSRWQKCGHKSIEIAEYCNTVFWRAGMTARLNPCPEQNFRAFFVRVGILDGLDFGTCKWIGQSGYCKMCEEEYHMPKAVPFRTYEDYEFLEGIGDLTGPIFAVKLAEPITYPPPPHSIQFSSTPNECVTKDFLDLEIAKTSSSPHEATPPIGENLLERRLKASLHHPHIFTPYINNTVADLISVKDQDFATLISIQDKDIPEGVPERGSMKELQELYFPAKMQMYELNQGVDGVTQQWSSRGYYEGMMVEGVPSQYFWNHCGMTPQDEHEKFKERGMDLAMFYQYGRKMEQHFEARGVRVDSKMGEIQRELGARSQAADGMQPFGTYRQGLNNNLQPGYGISHAQINPFGRSLEDLNQQHRQQQMQELTQPNIMQQVIQQQLVQQQMVKQQILRQYQVQQQQMWQQQMMQQMQQLQEQSQLATDIEEGLIMAVEGIESYEA
ncbi:hypothetical protein BTUL_0036g00250 [Botrytis tulipae]|uniref:MoaB/Mog domain-containing protein n=1 Tax=Botrytis tulipae TaxID=87230 RepID=A0A4Z1ETJ6_9HELO|nr:hypothetical protein BTUL_0036g00250 [Botrytis tulipae]